MKNALWLPKWILNAATFLTLSAFALNHQQTITTHLFFGNEQQVQYADIVDASAMADTTAPMSVIEPTYSDGL